MKIDSQKIIQLEDWLDQSTMLYYEQKEGKLKYLQCLDKVVSSLLNGDDPENEEIDLIFEKIEQVSYNQEEIRQALMFLVIKGFKHQHLDLDLITPDRIGVICAYLIDALSEEENISVLDLNLGTGNLLFTLNNYTNKEMNLIGIEKDETLIKVAQIFSEMMNINLRIYFQDALKDNHPSVDLIIADVDQYQYHSDTYKSELTEANINYFPYLLLEKHQFSGDADTQYMFIVPNDFFSQKGSDTFKKVISTQLEMVALIVLPETMFVDQARAKSILIMRKALGRPTGFLSVFNLPSISDPTAFITMINEISLELKAKAQSKS